MKRIVSRYFAMPAIAAVCCALSACGGSSGGGGGAPGGGGGSGPTPPATTQMLVAGDGNGTIWAYRLSDGGAPGAPTQFTLPNVQMTGGGHILVTLGDDGINVIDAQTFNGGSTLDGFTIPISSSGSTLVNGLAADGNSNIYVAVQNGFFVFHNTPGTTRPFAQIGLANHSTATGSIAIAHDESVAIQIGAFGSQAKTTARVLNPVGQGATGRAAVNLPNGSLGDPMGYDTSGRLIIDHANALYAYTISGATGNLTATLPLPSGPATFAIDGRDVVYALAGPVSSSQGQTTTLSAYAMNGGALTKLWSTQTPTAERWLAVVP